MRERRRFKRYRIMLEVEYDVEDHNVTIQSKAYTINVSEGGVAIPINKAIKTGRRINLKIRLPANDREIDAVGEVVWKEPVGSTSAPTDNAGIEFLEMEQADKLELVEFLRSRAS